jgi:hypothetical protein
MVTADFLPPNCKGYRSLRWAKIFDWLRWLTASFLPTMTNPQQRVPSLLCGLQRLQIIGLLGCGCCFDSHMLPPTLNDVLRLSWNKLDVPLVE